METTTVSDVRRALLRGHIEPFLPFRLSAKSRLASLFVRGITLTLYFVPGEALRAKGTRPMPPHADQLLEERILKAAQRLWRTRGEHGLTLRAVAREAGTTTPTVYKRFRNKQALLNTLTERFKAQLNEHLFASRSLEEVCSRYLAFAEEHRHEYQLLWHSWTDVFHPDQPRPGRAWVLTQFANRFGGNPEDYARAFYAIFLFGHGAASLLSVPGDEVARDEVRRNFLAISKILVQQTSVFRG
jgi:AcrR family transcriptional regulator